jgi:hypothetical protein
LAKKLWDFYGGEPFMENPHLAVIGANPFKVGSIIERKKSGFRKISQRKGSKTMAYKRKGKKNSPKRRRRARRNPIPGGGLMINRPRRRKRTYHMKKNRRGTYVHNPKHRRRARRNPAVLGVALPPINMIAWGAGGFIGVPMAEGYLTRFLPAEITTSVLGRYAVKIGTVLGLTYLVKHVLSAKEAFPVALGGSLYVVTTAINEFIPQLTQAPSPSPAVSAYRSGMINAYQKGGINAYRTGMIATGISGYAATNLARALPGLAQPSQMMPRFDIDSSGMKNPVFADPRFVNSPMVAR